MSIKNISDFINQLEKISELPENELFFRGHESKNYEIKPSIYRDNKLISNEHIMFKECILRTPNEFLNEKSVLEKLVKMQHYGLPTRLLDITSNPLVALFFACKDSSKDGKVICFSIPNSYIKYYDSDTVSILSNISKRPPNFCIEKLQTDEFNDKEEIQYLLHDIREEKSYFRPIINSDDIGKVIAVKVKQSNSRIIKQSGAFLIFGIGCEKTEPAQIPEEWLIGGANAGESVNLTIDKGAKEEIIKQLDRLGINESTLFPELDNQASYLKNKYLKEETPLNTGMPIDAN